MIVILKRVKQVARNPENLIYIAFISVFTHFVITALTIIVIGIGLLLHKKTRKEIFSFKGKGWFLAFTLYTAFTALCFRNFIGLACSFAFFLIICISYFVRANITEKVFERCLDICCFAAIPLAVATFTENALNSSVKGYTCKLWFFNENYFCSLLAAIVIICAFNATSHKGKVLKYYICAAFAGFAMYLGESMFAFVEVFVGILVVLVLNKKHKLIALALFVVVVGMIVLLAVPDIFPRLSEINVTSQRRLRIWNEAMPFIKENAFLGRGFLSFYQCARQNPSMYQTTHTHNFAIESLLSFGIIGTIILVFFLWSYFKQVYECKVLLRKNVATTLILTICTAVLVHTMTDLTLLWVQTGLLYALILGGVGIDEKALNKRIVACAGLGGKSDRKEE
ncbi:MAG: O-antigen ligase family protein [Clostridia bacterium]|nr:O-antigen ligase family protein [Clostridia bacterium]